MLRLHFTAEDLARVRISLLGPLAETELALWNLQQPDRKAMFGNWRAETGPRMNADGRDLARFLALPIGGLVDLFNLTGPASSFDEAMDLLHGVPHQQLCEELTFHPCLARRRAPWLGRVLERDRDAIGRLADSLTHCHKTAVAPYWTRIQRHLDTEAMLRRHLMTNSGLAALLDSLRPLLIWKAPVLEVPGYRPWQRSTDLHLAGRELILAPSVFCGPVPQLLARRHGHEVLLIYPALSDLPAASNIWAAPLGQRHGRATPQPLVALLGRTRANVLCAIADHPLSTTTQLASLVRISTSSASEHATVLRHAGLTTLARDHKQVRHSLSAVGLALINTTASTSPF
ncbi:winged helix-turn-helix domain-containing protein [Streptomyces sp. NPDC055078]